MIRLDGESLSVPHIAAVAAEAVPVTLTAEAERRIEASYSRAQEAAEIRPVYGRTTGVGANRDVTVPGSAENARSLLRSHATSAGAVRSAPRVRAMLVVRLNQLVAGGSGASPALAAALAAMLNRNALPEIREYVGIGTGDLGALAATGLALLGESRTPVPPDLQMAMGAHDALPLLSSNAATIGDAALACAALSSLARASVVIAALSGSALQCNVEAFAPEVERATPFPGARDCAAWMRSLLGNPPAARLQDPISIRCVPQVHGLLLDALTALESVIERYANSPQENPLILADGPAGPAGPAEPAGLAAVHCGSFHATYLASALTTAVESAAQAAKNSVRRLCLLNDPAYTELGPFLADATTGASGAMCLEYVATAALTELSGAATPVSTLSAVLSRGVEDDASFASAAARQALQAEAALGVVLACEGVAAVRALRSADTTALTALLGHALEVCADLSADLADRDLTPDIDLLSSRMTELAAVLPRPG